MATHDWLGAKLPHFRRRKAEIALFFVLLVLCMLSGEIVFRESESASKRKFAAHELDRFLPAVQRALELRVLNRR
jgi:hypothetical protein